MERTGYKESDKGSDIVISALGTDGNGTLAKSANYKANGRRRFIKSLQ